MVSAKEKSEQVVKRKGKVASYSDETIYVGNISPRTHLKNLTRHFKKYGEIKNVRLDKRLFRKMKIENTFAFIEYEIAESAIQALASNGFEMNDFHLIVQSEKEYEAGRDNTKCVFIHNLPEEALEEDLINFFKPHVDEIASVKVLRNKYSKQSKNCGYASFKTKKDLQAALNLHRKKIGEKRVGVEIFRTPEEKEKIAKDELMKKKKFGKAKPGVNSNDQKSKIVKKSKKVKSSKI